MAGFNVDEQTEQSLTARMNTVAQRLGKLPSGDPSQEHLIKEMFRLGELLKRLRNDYERTTPPRTTTSKPLLRFFPRRVSESNLQRGRPSSPPH